MENCNLEDTHEEKLTEMVELLLKDKQQAEFHKPSWKMVVIAIAVDDGGGDYSLAKTIAVKHPKGTLYSPSTLLSLLVVYYSVGIQARTGVSASPTSPLPVQCRSGQGSYNYIAMRFQFGSKLIMLQVLYQEKMFQLSPFFLQVIIEVFKMTLHQYTCDTQLEQAHLSLRRDCMHTNKFLHNYRLPLDADNINCMYRFRCVHVCTQLGMHATPI